MATKGNNVNVNQEGYGDDIIITCCDLKGIDIIGFNYVKQKVLLVDSNSINNSHVIKDVIKELSNIAHNEVVFR